MNYSQIHLKARQYFCYKMSALNHVFGTIHTDIKPSTAKGKLITELMT